MVNEGVRGDFEHSPRNLQAGVLELVGARKVALQEPSLTHVLVHIELSRPNTYCIWSYTLYKF